MVQLIPKLKGPVPSPLKVPLFACNVCPANVWTRPMSPTTTPVALNLKSWKSAATVCAHETVFGGPLAESTTICTPDPTWVTSHSAKRRRTTTARAKVL